MAIDAKAEDKKKDVVLDEVVPTLFIAVGGTGAEVLFRIRRRIMNTLWGKSGEPVRLNKLTDFPYASFLHVDLDANTVTESGKAVSTDLLSHAVKFKEDEKIVKKLDLGRYTNSDDDLDRYPLIKEWFPLSRKTINELNIDPEKGAGQIRAISRLYFFDKYEEIKSAIRSKADTLLANVSSDALQKRLGLKVQTGALKIVVVCSTAGGTGSGSFLDMGYLAGWLGKEAASAGASTNLVMMLPSGYKGANQTKTEANTYAALMELETCMRQGSRYIRQWTANEIPKDMPSNPYSDVYLIDTSNLAGAKTSDIKDIYEMVADALFEDFSTADFANKKRSIAVNQNQHKIVAYSPPLPRETYGDMKLSFSRGYSSFGQATIDTHLDQQQNIVLFRRVNDMLKTFFGVATSDLKANTPTEAERDELLASRMYLGANNEIIDYDFVTETDEYRKGAERTTYPLVNELLRVNGIQRLDDIEKKIEDNFEGIRAGGNYKEWPSKIEELIKQVNQDSFKGVEQASGLHEDAVKKRRIELLAELLDPARKDGLIRALWSYVDNKERGGLDYTIELIKRLKDRLENANTGLAKYLNENSKWFSDLSGHLRNEESGKLQEHLLQAIGKFIGAQGQSESKLKQIGHAVKLYVRYHLLAVASREAAILVRELSDGLGLQIGTSEAGNPVWTGFIGELEAGRQYVRNIVSAAEAQIALTQEAMKREHAMYFCLPSKNKFDGMPSPSAAESRQWAEEAFADFGGTQILFAILKDEDGRDNLLAKLRNRALLQLGGETLDDQENPLFAALDAHPNRTQLFGDFLQRAMPWVAAKVEGYLKPNSPNDQYKCFIGVKNSKAFEAKYGQELKSRLPTMTMITAKEIGFVDIATPGKVVCYVELSGLPLPSLKALDQWHVSYRSEDKIPVHAHRRLGTFVHARELSLEELASRADDFQLFIMAVALGVLTRTNKGDDAGVYSVQKQGRSMAVGEEKKIRLNGLSDSYRRLVQDQVDADLEQLSSPEQLAMWVALLEAYAQRVYPIAVLRQDGEDVERKSLPTLMCEHLRDEWSQRLERKAGGRMQALLKGAHNAISEWTNELPATTLDVYAYEVNPTGDPNAIEPKRALRREVFEPDWTFLPVPAAPTPAAAFVPAPAVTPAMAAPPPLLDIAYWLAVNGQPTGPHNEAQLQALRASGHLTRESKVWKEGMAGWISAAEVADLARFIAVPPSLGGMPPPLI